MNANFTISMIEVQFLKMLACQFRSSAPLALHVPEEENSSVDMDISTELLSFLLE